MWLLFIVAYIILCVLCGLVGKNTRFGFIGWFLISLIATPVIGCLLASIAYFRKRKRANKARQKALNKHKQA
ncbi:MAG: hypothetical protein GKR95_14820 [Gammaproteobacteria bacterium]|nr:hypothetical protein [Gammaproteobacteria bacterium]